MNIFDEWEGRDPLDFTNRPKKSGKKQTVPTKQKKPFHKTPAGTGCGCLLWILLITLIWSSCQNFRSEIASNAPSISNESSEIQGDYRTITPEEKKFIGQHARNVIALQKQYRSLQTVLEVKILQDKAKEGFWDLGHYLYGSRLKEYDDIREAYNALISVAGAFISQDRNYYTEEKKYFAIIKQNCSPYLEWRGTPDTSKILKSVTLDWSQCPESDKKQIGKHARYLEEQKERYLALVNEPGFIQQGYKLNYETWQDTLLAELDKLTENVPYENHDYYQDVESATFELVDAIAYSDSWRQRSDFKEKVKNFIRLFDERLTPYLEW
ncbi:MAG: hypothetical protein Q4A17_07575 [Thermoguttaceae bacterium]|nr:hypothetical protein [Thermoguttaceae bacterium]